MAADNPTRQGGVQTGVAVPLLYEGQLLGTLSVSSGRPEDEFNLDDAEVLELLASVAASAMAGTDQARLNGVLLAARTAQHELNNRLAVTLGYAEILAYTPSLSEETRELAHDIVTSARAASDILTQMRLIARIEETDWGSPVGTTINLADSTRRDRSREVVLT
jgi:signal transduction histidine kinase